MKSKSKVALVTGGSRGLGRNMALSLAGKGIDVILTYNTKRAEALAVVEEIKTSGQNAVAIQLNVSDVKSFSGFFEQVHATLKSKFDTDHFDYLINNAGIGLHKPFAETTEEEFDQLMTIHFKSVFFISQKALALINDGGRILNISTGLARFSTPGYSAYAAMKGGVETLTKYMAKELGARRIAVNIVAPGAIETDFNGGAVRDNTQLNKIVADMTALGRVGLPD
ncbi:MAG: short-chain dehydrogenase, partial [Marivirga sp.]|nr:short-chain dehydrogenase [Marivirga sp.]